MIKKLILANFLLALQLISMNSHAALFDDKEARKKILEVEATMNSQNQLTQGDVIALKNTQQALEQRMLDAEAITKGQGLIDMQNQLETLKDEVARLKGELEVASHNVEANAQRQKDLYGDIDSRLRKLEGSTTPETAASSKVAEVVPAPASSALPANNSQEYQLLELANGLSKESKHKDAYNAYDKFIKDYPTSALSADALYGLGYSQYALKNYKSAIATQEKLVVLYPKSTKVADAMMSMANSQIQLGLVPNAKKTLRDLISNFPNSDVTPTAQKRLKALEAIK
jgi:tol-pal system protein YbgF